MLNLKYPWIYFNFFCLLQKIETLGVKMLNLKYLWRLKVTNICWCAGIWVNVWIKAKQKKKKTLPVSIGKEHSIGKISVTNNRKQTCITTKQKKTFTAKSQVLVDLFQFFFPIEKIETLGVKMLNLKYLWRLKVTNLCWCAGIWVNVWILPRGWRCKTMEQRKLL